MHTLLVLSHTVRSTIAKFLQVHSREEMWFLGGGDDVILAFLQIIEIA